MVVVSYRDISRFGSLALLLFGGWAFAQTSQPAQTGPATETKEACESCEPKCTDHLTGDWFGARTKLEDAGIDINLTFVNIYQVNVHGGADTKDAQRFDGLYDLDVTLDLEKLFKLKGGQVYALAEGGYGNGLEGAGKIGDLFGVNYNVIGYRSVDLIQLWYQQNLFDDKLQLRLGKIDMTGTFECRGCPVSFDGNRFANDEYAQFINGALVNNPTIPFPDEGLGAIAHFSPLEWFYTSVGVADAQADRRETGFNTTFHDEAYFLGMYEFGFVPHIPTAKGPLVGAYRFGLWYDPQPRERYYDNPAGDRPARFHRDNLGFYTSFDQTVYRENSESDQGLGLFFRYGFTPGDTNIIEHFWSIGGQYQGLIPKRDNDVLGFGVAQGLLSNELGYYDDTTPGRETVMELYYNIQITEWLHLTPDIQYIFNPGGIEHAGHDVTVMGLRLWLSL